MVAPVVQVAVLAAAGVLAGTASSAGAIGSLISYPALLAVGIPALAANVTNAVASVAIGGAASIASRPELRGTGARMLRWAVITAVGAALGAALLLLTPTAFFDWIVPFLLAGAAVVLLLQPRLARHSAHPLMSAWVLPLGLFAVAVYDGYFGAGSGIMTLSLLLVSAEALLTRANALKNALLGVADVVAATAFVIAGPVYWAAVVPLGLGYLAGGAIGPSVTRRVPSDLLRVLIGSAGLGFAAWLLVAAIRG